MNKEQAKLSEAKWDIQYLNSIAQECLKYKTAVEREIWSDTQSFGDAEEIVDEAIVRVITYAVRHGSENKIENVESFLSTTARRLLINARRKKRRDKSLQTVSLDESNEEMTNQAVDSSAERIQQHIEADELAKIALRDATDEELRLFRMWFIDQMTAKEIAARLKVTTQTVSGRVKRLVALLRSEGHLDEMEDSIRYMQLENHFTSSLIPASHHYEKPVRAKEARPKLEEEFRNLVEQWRRETMHISSTTERATNFAYQQIIGMGEKALPLIFRELQETGGHWFWALRAITRQNPVPSEARGNINGMAQAWLEWGRQRGYV